MEKTKYKVIGIKMNPMDDSYLAISGEETLFEAGEIVKFEVLDITDCNMNLVVKGTDYKKIKSGYCTGVHTNSLCQKMMLRLLRRYITIWLIILRICRVR